MCSTFVPNLVYFSRSRLCKVDSEDIYNVDYIYCLRYYTSDAVQNNFQPLEVTNTTVSCNLAQRQRSSQQILDFADYLQMHSLKIPIRRYDSPNSFSSDVPLWIELASPNSFFDYLNDKFEFDDVMLQWDEDNEPSNLNEIKEFCRLKNWRCTEAEYVRGSEASVTILYGFNYFIYEYLTRAKTKLVIVTFIGIQRYFHQL